MPQTAELPVESTGLYRRWRRLCWSVNVRIRPDRSVVLPFDDGMQIRVPQIDRLGKSVCLNGYSDRDHALLLHRFLEAGMCYFDVGAHFGQFTLVAARRVGSRGQVHSFEATRHIYDQLIDNVKLNELSCVTATHAAVFNKAGEAQLQVCIPGKGAFNAIGKPLRPDQEIVGLEAVRTITLDDYCAERNLTHIDLMKIDTNGAEVHVLQGARRILSGPDAPVLVCEFNDVTTGDMGFSTADVRSELHNLGYKLYTLESDGRTLRPEPDDQRYPETVDVLAVKDAAAFERIVEA